MNGFSFSQKFAMDFMVYLLVLARVSAFVAVSPIFGSMAVPNHWRILFSFALAYILYPFSGITYDYVVGSAFWVSLIYQVLSGITLGAVTFLFFEVFRLAGQMYALPMGLGIASSFDPTNQMELPLIGQLKFAFAVLAFLAMDGHHLLIAALAESFKVLPVASYSNVLSWGKAFLDAFRKYFLLGFQIAAPVLGILFIVNLALGLLYLAASQMNIMVLGLLITIVAGFLAILFFVPYFLEFARTIFKNLPSYMLQVLRGTF